jgi:hypothetical protein
MEQFTQAYNWRDAAVGEVLTTPDFVRYSVTTTQPMPRAAWREMREGFVVAFPDEKWEVRQLRPVTTRCTSAWLSVARPWTFPDGTVVQPTGRSYRADCTVLFQLDPSSHKIASYLQPTTPGFFAVGLAPEAVAAFLRNGF